jgi:periplasmic divalent cation tolerance protein
MSDKCVVLTTASSYEEARKIACQLVEQKLAACVNIVPQITSIYRWKDNVDEARECLLVVKTTANLFDRVCGAIKELHSYDLPECISLKIGSGSADYLKWIGESVEKTNPKGRREKRRGAHRKG